MTTHEIASILSATFWKAYWITMRPYLLFVSGAAGLVGLACSDEPEVFRLVLAFVPLFLSYGLGQALTDCFQIDTDAISSPYRPLVRGIVSPKQVLVVSLSGLSLTVLILIYLNPKILLLGILGVIGLLTYTKLKRTWWGGPPWNSWIVALLPVMARLVDRNYQILSFFNFSNPKSLMFFLAVSAVFFGYANFVVMGYFKDISADRKTGYSTFPVVFGWTPAAIYSDLTALAAAVLTGLVLLLSDKCGWFGMTIFAAAVIINVYAQYKIHRTRREEESHAPISNVVRAFILYCLSIAVTLKPSWVFFLAAFYALFEVTLRLRPERSQV